MTPTLEALLDVAHRLANAAGEVTLSQFRGGGVAEHKGSGAFDPVTAADRAAEKAMREILAGFFPSHSILGEEFGAANAGGEYTWVLDPIDGTRAYILGFPLWGTLVGLKRFGVPLLGVMDQPFTGERMWSDARAAWYRGPRGPLVRCRTRACGALSDAFLTASSPDMFEGDDADSFEALSKRVRMRRFGGDCYAYAMLALGHIDIVAEARLKPYDIAPLIPIIEKAGGAVASWTGGNAAAGGNCVACGDAALLPDVIAALAPQT